MENRTVLVLYTELAGYTIACLNSAARSGLNLHVVHWPINSEAPFQLNADDSIRCYNRKDYDYPALTELVSGIAPELIMVSGWIDKVYVKSVAPYSKNIPVVLVLDNPWKGTFRQWLGVIYARFFLSKTFTHCWVPGKSQKAFARHLGFSENKIEEGIYSADVDHFSGLYYKSRQQKSQNFPKRFLYVGRYLDFKGINELWTAFIEFRKDTASEWELWCVGAGEGFDSRVKSEGIRHLGFLQPHEMESIIEQCGVFILPSRKEPWGVVVHEFAAAGFPLICSTAVGAAEAFLVSGENGFFHKPESVTDIKEAMKKTASKSTAELTEMGYRSHELAQKINPVLWTQRLLNFLPNKM